MRTLLQIFEKELINEPNIIEEIMQTETQQHTESVASKMSNANINNTVFVFHKDGVVKAFDLETLKDIKGKSLINQGWAHTATLNPCAFIEFLANNKEYVEIINAVKQLSFVR